MAIRLIGRSTQRADGTKGTSEVSFGHINEDGKFEEAPAPQTPAHVVAERRFAEIGLSEIPRPLKTDGNPLNPILPQDLTVLDDIQLARLYSEFCLMAQYVKLQLARKVVEHSEDKRQEKMTRALVRLAKSGQVGDKDSKTEIDPQTKDSAYRTQVSYGTQVLTEAMMEVYLIGRDACSREQTRRQKIWEDRR